MREETARIHFKLGNRAFERYDVIYYHDRSFLQAFFKNSDADKILNNDIDSLCRQSSPQPSCSKDEDDGISNDAAEGKKQNSKC